MAVLKCVSNYSSSLGTFKKGDETDELSADQAALLMRDSPGSFEEVVPKAKDRVEAVSEETASGAKAPDRRARGGRKRG
jgi:hypothetical protein